MKKMTYKELTQCFRSRFLQLRGDMKQMEFSQFLGVNVETLKKWEHGHLVPNALSLHNISEACNVSIDWLLGVSDIKERK
jgi:DNA-binding transcriptional regulator YiaG